MGTIIIPILFIFLAMPRGLQDLSSPTGGGGVEPMPPAMQARSPNHWTAREVPKVPSLSSGTEICTQAD